MPSNASLAKDLEKRFKQYAPEKNRDKIGHVLEVFKEKKNIDYRTVVNLVMALSSPSILGKAGQEKQIENTTPSFRNTRMEETTGVIG